ncbi:MAG TPA: MG2 domain-containing protein, partial [Opitutaceae bacterium]|nr:MG2 domain-containing protein [Opitutaceae bacterium]
PLIALAEHEGHAVTSSEPFYSQYRENRSNKISRTALFTDRSLYRPGQVIHYKGIATATGPSDGENRVLSNEAITVFFFDTNGKQIAKHDHRTNDYGSFSGTFTDHVGRLTGQMTIRTFDPPGTTQINVEEYKRPKFIVEMSTPENAVKLGSEVKLPGKATSYSGIGIGNAAIKWRVTRVAQMPSWYGWWQPAQEQAISHGTATTAPDGSFSVEFTAKPDLKIPEKNEPTFLFKIIADVTDSTGETRVAQRVIRVGYAALQVSVSSEEWQTPQRPVTLTISTHSLAGDPAPAQGTVTLHALKQPAKVQRASLSNPTWYRRPNRHSPPTDPSNPESWELGESVTQRQFSSDNGGAARVDVHLPAGFYRATV